jgi:serine/threonine protein kinase
MERDCEVDHRCWMAKIHLAGILQRDVKPSNILMDKSRDPKICNFGSGRGQSLNWTFTRPIGTLFYMARGIYWGRKYPVINMVFAAESGTSNQKLKFTFLPFGYYGIAHYVQSPISLDQSSRRKQWLIHQQDFSLEILENPMVVLLAR